MLSVCPIHTKHTVGHNSDIGYIPQRQTSQYIYTTKKTAYSY